MTKLELRATIAEYRLRLEAIEGLRELELRDSDNYAKEVDKLREHLRVIKELAISTARTIESNDSSWAGDLYAFRIIRDRAAQALGEVNA